MSQPLKPWVTSGVYIGFDGGFRYLVGYEETEAGIPFLHLLEPRLSRR